jgi:hypothetical protein
MFGYFCNCQKLPKINNRPKGKDSPNLATLLTTVQPRVVNKIVQLLQSYATAVIF